LAFLADKSILLFLMFKALKDRPWIWFIALFVAMVAATVAVVIICERNEPASVPLDTPKSWSGK